MAYLGTCQICMMGLFCEMPMLPIDFIVNDEKRVQSGHFSLADLHRVL